MTEVSEISVTIKYPSNMGNPWFVSRGKPYEVRKHIIEYFGLDEAAVKDKTLHDLTVLGQGIAQGKARAPLTAIESPSKPEPEVTQEQAIETVKEVLGGEVVEDTDTGSVWGDADDDEPEVKGDEHAGLIAALSSAATIDELKKLYATNREAFSAESVMEAYKARGRSLKDAA